MLRRLATCVVFLLAGAAGRAHACGVSATGVASCSLAEHAEQVRPRWVTGASGVYTSTRLRFSGGVRARQTRTAALAQLAFVPIPALVLQAGIGAALGGELELPDGRHEFEPGPLFALGADWRVFDDGRWFALLTSLLSISAAWTRLDAGPRVGYEAIDVRLGGAIGIDIADVLRPFALARVFGGPVFWSRAGSEVTGTDTHHYQLGAGLSVRAFRQLNLFVEGVPLGERAVAGGVGVLF